MIRINTQNRTLESFTLVNFPLNRPLALCSKWYLYQMILLEQIVSGFKLTQYSDLVRVPQAVTFELFMLVSRLGYVPICKENYFPLAIKKMNLYFLNINNFFPFSSKIKIMVVNFKVKMNINNMLTYFYGSSGSTKNMKNP